MIARVLILLVALSSIARLHASDQPTRIVQYLYDGEGVKKRVSITSFSGGAAIATFSASGKTPIKTELTTEEFRRIWEAFTSLDELKRADITSSKTTVDTDTHHVFFTLEKSASGATDRSYAVLASEAGPEFKAWLRHLEPKRKEANQPLQRNASTGFVSNFESPARRG